MDWHANECTKGKIMHTFACLHIHHWLTPNRQSFDEQMNLFSYQIWLHTLNCISKTNHGDCMSPGNEPIISCTTFLSGGQSTMALSSLNPKHSQGNIIFCCQSQKRFLCLKQTGGGGGRNTCKIWSVYFMYTSQAIICYTESVAVSFKCFSNCHYSQMLTARGAVF